MKKMLEPIQNPGSLNFNVTSPVSLFMVIPFPSVINSSPAAILNIPVMRVTLNNIKKVRKFYTDILSREMKSKAINIDAEIMGGTPVFTGTRVPIQALFDYIETGETLDEFLENFPTVERRQVVEVLELARKTVSTFSSSRR